MRFAFPICLLFAFASLLSAADLPKPMTEEERAEAVKKWQESYTEKRDRLADELEKAKTTAKLKPTNTNENAVANISKRLAEMVKSPDTIGAAFYKTITKNPATGQIGFLISARKDQDRAGVVKETMPEGVVVETICAYERVLLDSDGKAITYKSGALKGQVMTRSETDFVRFFVVTKLKAKKGEKITLNGPWHVAGTTDIDGKAVPVLYRFDIKPSDVPKVPKK